MARLPPCGARRFQWTAEPVDASTTPRFSSAVPSLGHVMLPGFLVVIRGNRHGHSRDPSPFGHRSSPEAPSLHRHYPASLVLQASPPPCRPNLTLTGCRLARATPPDRASRVASTLLFHACCRQYPGGTRRCVRRSLPDGYQPSPLSGRVGFRITRFEAYTAFTGVAARMVAKPPLAARCAGVLQTMSLPPSSAPTATGWSDSCRAGFAPAEEWHLSTAHRITPSYVTCSSGQSVLKAWFLAVFNNTTLNFRARLNVETLAYGLDFPHLTRSLPHPSRYQNTNCLSPPES